MMPVNPNARTRAWRRAQRERAVAKARKFVNWFFGNWGVPPDEDKLQRKALLWADNLKKCSCPMCNSGDPHDHRQFLRADAALRDDLNPTL